MEGREMARAQHPLADERREPQLDRGEIAERAFRPDEQMREIVRLVHRHQRVEVVAPNAAGEPGKPLGDERGVALAQGQHVDRDAVRRRAARRVAPVPGAEPRLRAVGENGLDREHVVAHRAVAERSAAAGIIGGHPADRRARGGRDVDREPEAMALQRPVQLVEHEPRLDPAATVLDVEIQNAVQVPGIVEHQSGVHRLAALRRPAAAGGDGDPGRARRAEGRGNVGLRARHCHAQRHDLVERGVRRVAAARERVEENLALEIAPQPFFQHPPLPLDGALHSLFIDHGNGEPACPDPDNAVANGRRALHDAGRRTSFSADPRPERRARPDSAGDLRADD